MNSNVYKVLIESATLLDMRLEELIKEAQSARDKLKEDIDVINEVDIEEFDEETAMALHKTYFNVTRRCMATTAYIHRHVEHD